MYYILAIFNIFIAAVAQMMLKKSAASTHTTMWREYLNPWVVGGYILMLFSLVSNVFVLSKGVLLKEMGAIGALSYLFVPMLAFFLFKEKFSKRQLFAIALIVLGSAIFFWE